MLEYLYDLLFPKFCQNCQKEGEYLCDDCFSLIDFLAHSPYRSQNIKNLFCAAPYNNFIIQRLIKQIKYEPFVKDLAKTLALIIIHYLKLNEKQISFPKGAMLIPIPLSKKRLKYRGFNQAEEIAKELSSFWKIPLANDILFKVKETFPQVGLSKEEREKNIKGVFVATNSNLIKNKTILILDDVFTTGATLEEAARILKKTGAKEIWAITVAKE